MKKEKKVQSPKQKLASERNWAKARVIGARNIPHMSPLTSIEKKIFKDIDELYKKLVYNWDNETKIIINDNEKV